MRALLRLALRNLGRNRRRTALTATAVVAGVGALVVGEAFIGGVEENVIVAAEDGLVGHVTARPAGYPGRGLQHPVDSLLELGPAARAFLDATTAAWTERTLFSPLATNGRDAVRVRAIGYDPRGDEAVFPRTLWSVKGSLPAPTHDEIAVSPGVSRLLGVGPGDRLILQVRTHPGAINALEVRVAGVVTTNNSALDHLGILVPQRLARSLIAADEPTHVSVRLRSRGEAQAYAPRLAAALDGQAEVVTWEDETRELLRLQQIRRRALDIVVAILLALAGLGMANTILIAAHERVREVGTLRAMGMSEADVLGLFLLEGSAVGLGAGALGAAWGGGLAAWWARHPIQLGRLIDELGSELSVSALVYTQFRPAMLAYGVAFALVIAVLASLYPARVAARMSPADAVRAE